MAFARIRQDVDLITFRINYTFGGPSIMKYGSTPARVHQFIGHQRATGCVVARLDRAIQYSRDACHVIEKPRRTEYPACAGYDGFLCSSASAGSGAICAYLSTKQVWIASSLSLLAMTKSTRLICPTGKSVVFPIFCLVAGEDDEKASRRISEIQKFSLANGPKSLH